MYLSILNAMLVQVREEDSLEKAARTMLDFRISSVPIVDSEGRPVDVICKTDIAYALANVNNFKVHIEMIMHVIFRISTRHLIVARE